MRTFIEAQKPLFKFQSFNVVKQGKTLMQILIVPHKKSRIAAQSSTFAEFMSLQELA